MIVLFFFLFALGGRLGAVFFKGHFSLRRVAKPFVGTNTLSQKQKNPYLC